MALFPGTAPEPGAPEKKQHPIPGSPSSLPVSSAGLVAAPQPGAAVCTERKGTAMTPSRNLTAAVRSVLSDVTEGFLEIIHNSLALLGIAVVLTLITLTARPDWREDGEEKLRAWLLQRQEALEDNTAM